MANESEKKDEEVLEEKEEEKKDDETEDKDEESESKEDDETSESNEAKAARLLRQTNQARKKLGLEPLKEQKTESRTKKSDELDYGQKAFLNSNGIKGKAELEFVQKELKASGESIDDLLENEYFQNKLESFRKINKTKNAIITGKRGGGPAIDSVEYWATKPIEEVPQEMRIKVVNHKIAKDKNKGVFYNS